MSPLSSSQPLRRGVAQGIVKLLMLFYFLLIVEALVATGLVAVILVQKSEGGGLGTGGSPSGLMSARGAADFLTRLTTILATAFISLSIALSFVAAMRTQTLDVKPTAATPAPAAPLQPGSGAAPLGQQRSGPSAAELAAQAAAGNQTAPAEPAAGAPGNSSVPLER